MKARTRHVVLITLGLAAVAAGVLVFRPAAVPSEAAYADSGTVQVTVDWTGKTRVRDRYQVAAPVSGQLARITLLAGDRVRAGDVVAHIAAAAASPLDPRSRAELTARLEAARAARAEAVAGLDRASTALAQARSDAARAESMKDAGGLSAQALDTALFEVRTRDGERRMAEAAAQRAIADVEAARAALSAGQGLASGPIVEVRAPAHGAVLRVLRESAGPVTAGTILLELGDLARVEVVLDLPTADAVRVRSGQRALVSGWGGGATLAAAVRRIEPSAYTKVSPLGVEEQRVDVVLDPDGAGWETLGDGFAVDVQIVVQELTNVVRIPTSALFRDGNRWALYVVEDRRARRRDVEVMVRGNGIAAVGGGVRPGERVLVHPGDQVADGVRVTLR